MEKVDKRGQGYDFGRVSVQDWMWKTRLAQTDSSLDTRFIGSTFFFYAHHYPTFAYRILSTPLPSLLMENELPLARVSGTPVLRRWNIPLTLSPTMRTERLIRLILIPRAVIWRQAEMRVR
jgi:hypothetical protein